MQPAAVRNPGGRTDQHHRAVFIREAEGQHLAHERPDLARREIDDAGNLFADKSTALTAAQAIAAALFARERGNGGQHVEIPMLDACLYFFWPDGMMDKTVLAEDAMPGFLLSSVYNLTQTSDGHIVYFVINDAQRHALFDAVGLPEWKEDERFTMQGTADPAVFEEMGAGLAEAFSTISTAEVLERLIEADVPCGPVLDADGRVDAVVGSPGGPTILTTVLQVLLNRYVHGMSPRAAVAAPRFHRQDRPPHVQFEPARLGSELRSRLGVIGQPLRVRHRIGDVNAIFRLRGGGVEAVADPRSGGAAAALEAELDQSGVVAGE